jgi:hypothetical protein
MEGQLDTEGAAHRPGGAAEAHHAPTRVHGNNVQAVIAGKEANRRDVTWSGTEAARELGATEMTPAVGRLGGQSGDVPSEVAAATEMHRNGHVLLRRWGTNTG